ncbi:MAG: uroporphyrinogen decarboxylase family protein [Anaerolineae bacterium]
MTGRERLLAALHFEPTDRVPWAPLIDRYFTRSLPPDRAMDVVESLRYIGADILERHTPTVRVSVPGVEREEVVEDNERTQIIHTPVGPLITKWRQTETTDFLYRPPLQSLDDFEPYIYLADHAVVEPAYDRWQEAQDRIGDDGLAVPSGPLSPIQALLQHDMKIENVYYFLADHPREMAELVAAMHRRNKRIYEVLAASPAPLIIDYEDTSTTVMSPAVYRQWSMPYIDEYADICHAGGKVFITHMCGTLRGVADVIGMGRQDGVDSLGPEPTGDITAAEARAVWGEGKVIIGGIAPPTMKWSTPEQLRVLTTEILESMRPCRGFILSSGDATPYGTPLENLVAITEAVRAFPL